MLAPEHVSNSWKLTLKRNEYTYTIALEHDEAMNGYTVLVPALPGCVTQGETVEEAIDMARDAIRVYLESLIKSGDPIPIEREGPHVTTIKVVA